MRITHYHGMTESSFNNWLKGNGKSDNVNPWKVSDNDGLTYLWGVDALAEVEYIDHEGEDRKQEFAASMAFESAQCQWCLDDSEHIYIFGLSIEDAVAVEPDTSCENMTGAFCIHESEFTKDRVVSLVKYKTNKWYKPFMIANLMHLELFNIPENTDPALIKCAESLGDDHFVDSETISDLEPINAINEIN